MPRPPKDPTLRSTLELLLLLEALPPEEGALRNHALLVPVELPAKLLLGFVRGQLLVAPAERPRELRTRAPAELLMAHPTASPVVPLQATFARWDDLGSGGIDARLSLLERPADRARCVARVQAAMRAVRKFRKSSDPVLAVLPEEPAWRRCLVCSPLDALSSSPRLEDWPADHAQVRSRFLEIVGAPTFHDHGSRDWCLKRCLLCRATYLWKSDYEYLVNGGTEDEITLTRLTAEEAAPWEARVAARLREG